MSLRFVSRLVACAYAYFHLVGIASAADWKPVNRLIDQRQFNPAKGELQKIIKENKTDQDLTLAVTKLAGILESENKYEEAIELLNSTPRPKSRSYQAIIDLYTAKAMFAYIDTYSWEIRQREQTLSAGNKALRSMTQTELYAAALSAYEKAWEYREDLGKQNTSDYKNLIQASNYPAHIRRTLRDAISYKIMEALENTSYWQPTENNNLYTLPLDKLLAGDLKSFGTSNDMSVSDSSIHPLVRMAFVAENLAAWNRSKKNHEGALEAQISLHRSIHAVVQSEDEKKLVRQHLATLLTAHKNLSWSASGYGHLASMHLDSYEPVTGHKVASQCIATYKSNIELCSVVKNSLEQPSLYASAMAVDGANKRSFRVQYKNLKAVSFRAYKLDLAERSDPKSQKKIVPDQAELEQLRTKKPDYTWQTTLPQASDFRQHDAYITPPFSEPGLYAVIASAKDDFSTEDNNLSAFPFIISKLVMTSESVQDKPGETVATVVEGDTGKPVRGASVTMYSHTPYNQNDERIKIDEGTTDANGRVKLEGPTNHRQLLLIAKKDGLHSILVNPNVGYKTHRVKEKQSLIFTDRGAYRPGQKIHWKVVSFTRTEGSSVISIAPKQKFKVTLHDTNSQQVRSKTVTSNAFGSASGEFTIPEGLPLGHWYLTTSHGHNTHSISIEEYKRPTFEVSFQDLNQQYRVNENVEISGSARYHFGAPVTEGNVTFKVERQPRYPSWLSFIFWRQPPSTRTEVIASGQAQLSSDGTFKIAFVPKAKKATSPFERSTAYNYNVSVDITDNGGETRSQSTSLIAGHVTVQADLNAVPAVCFNATACKLSITRQTLNGVGAEGPGTVKLVALIPPKTTVAPADIPIPGAEQNTDSLDTPMQTPGDLLRPRWDTSFALDVFLGSWKEGKQIGNESIAHGKDGRGEIQPKNLSAGAYKLIYSTKDSSGQVHEAWKYFTVAEAGHLDLKTPIFLAAERLTEEAGKSLRLFVHNDTPTRQFVTLYRQQRAFQEIPVEPGSHFISVPITSDMRGGFTASLQAIYDYQHISFNENIFVPWSDKSLDVSFERLRDTMRPGTKESFTIRVKGANATDRAAEVLAFMYDKSLDLIQTNHIQNPLSLFPNTTGSKHIGTNLGEVGGISIQSQGFARIKEAPQRTTDFLLDPDGTAYEGPTRRRLGYGGVYRKNTRALSLSADGALSAGMQQEAVTMAETEAARAPASAAPADSKTLSASQTSRENFAETVFFIPHMTTTKDGSVTASFTLPDSLTAWNVSAVAFMKDFASGIASREVRTAKDLMTRLYVPRFVREGDELSMRIVVNNMSKSKLNGQLTLRVFDADTNTDLGNSWSLSLKRPNFSIDAEGSAAINATAKIPPGVRTVKVEARAAAGSFSDGEIRTFPVLPGRMHLVQSKFIALQPESTEAVTFDDLKHSTDPSRINEKLVVTADAQLFFSTLKALPYLVNFPYESSEQTLNRFLSASIMSSLFASSPELMKAAKKFAKRDTQLEPWNKNDPNQRMLFEETPWLQDALGGKNTSEHDLINLLLPETASALQKKALADLQKMQTDSGGFPWFPGGAPSPYMSLYIVYGLAKAQEFGISVPDNMIKNSWKYLGDHFSSLWTKDNIDKGYHVEFLTFLNFTASAFERKNVLPSKLADEDRKKMLQHSLRHWKSMSPYLQLMISLTAHRMGELKDADLILSSVLDRAKTTKESGTFWAMEDRSWLWYNDSVEMHAFALRVLSEMRNDSKLIPGLVQWIFLNKKLNQWKSTKATAEVIYSVATHLRKLNATPTDERIEITVGRDKNEFVFSKDEYTGRQFFKVDGSKVTASSADVTATSKSKSLTFVSATWHYSTEVLPTEGRGDFFTVDRKYFLRKLKDGQMTLTPLTPNELVKVGDEVEVQISIKNKHQAEFIHLRDPRPSGFEPVSMNSRYRWDLGISWYEEVRDIGSNFFFDWLPTGEYTFKYRLRAANAGTFKSMPAEIQSLYAPEFNAFSSGRNISIAN